MQNKLNKLQRDTYITWFTQTMGYVHKDEGIQPATKLPVLVLQSRKMKGYNLQQNHCTSSSRSHSLSSSTIQYPHPVPYSTHIQYNLQWSLLNPYKGLITCNTMGQYHGLQHNHVPKPCARPNHLWLNPESRLTLTSEGFDNRVVNLLCSLWYRYFGFGLSG